MRPRSIAVDFRVFSVTAFFLILLLGPARAGAWLLPKGKGLLILSTTMISSGRAFDADGNPVAIPRYSKFETSAWVEYGLTDRFTLVFRPQFRSERLGKPFDLAYSGLGDTALGVRIGLWSGRDTVFSLQSMLRIPGNPRIDGSQFETEVRALYGRSYRLGAWPAFIDSELAYRFRGGAAPDEVRSDVTFGVKPRPDLTFMAQAFSTFSIGGAGRYYATGWEYKAALSLVWDFAKNWSVQVGGIATVAGMNALQERGYFAAIWKRF